MHILNVFIFSFSENSDMSRRSLSSVSVKTYIECIDNVLLNY